MSDKDSLFVNRNDGDRWWTSFDWFIFTMHLVGYYKVPVFNVVNACFCVHVAYCQRIVTVHVYICISKFMIIHILWR